MLQIHGEACTVSTPLSPDSAALRFYPEPAQRALAGDPASAIYAASWAPTAGRGHFPLAWDPQYSYVNAHDVSAMYAHASPPDAARSSIPELERQM